MQEKIENALKHSKADYTEIRLEEKDTSTVVYRGKDLETVSRSNDSGGIVRCLVRKDGWGVATFNSFDELETRVSQAYECARVGETAEPIELAHIDPEVAFHPAALEYDFRTVPLGEKKALVEHINGILLSYGEKIVDTRTTYSDNFARYTFASSEGAYLEEERPHVGLGVNAVARDGENVQSAYESAAGPNGFEFVLGRDQIAHSTAKRALDLLKAETVKGGQYTVIADPVLAGVFIHEAFGHLSESDFIYENPKAREMMVLGRRFGQDFLNVFDDGSVEGLRGTHPYDDEGTPTRHNDLIKNGILVGRLHSRETAAKLGEPPTGNARAVNYRHPPIVRMTNTAIQNGSVAFEEMIKDIRLGVYACDAYGGETALENFSFSAGHAYMIRDGQIAEMVKDVVLAGNLFTTLMNIDAVGSDFRWIKQGGGCGKGAQYPLPVAFGAPHIRIQNVVIGGK